MICSKSSSASYWGLVTKPLLSPQHNSQSSPSGISSSWNLLLRRSSGYHSSSKNLDLSEKVSPRKAQRDLILSVLEAHPSVRDSRLYLKSFAPPPQPAGKPPRSISAEVQKNKALDGSDREQPSNHNRSQPPNIGPFPTSESMPTTATLAASNSFSPSSADEIRELSISTEQSVSVAESILLDPHQHTGVVKIQGPFTDRQLQSIVDGMIYLKKLGLMAIIVLDDEEWQYFGSDNFRPRTKPRGIFSLERKESLKQSILREATRLTEMFEERGGETRPMMEGVLRLGDGLSKDSDGLDLWVDNMSRIRSAIEHQEIPIIPPIAINSSCATVCISANEAVRAITKGLAQAGKKKTSPFSPNVLLDQDPEHPLTKAICSKCIAGSELPTNGVDLTPLRLMIVNREGGIPSPARSGHPHLSINLASEYQFIHETFRWQQTHPTSLSNLTMVKACLKHLPNESSAVIVSHRSPKSLIANLITNKPAHSPSLNHAILSNHHRGVGQGTPTLIRKGLPIRVIRGLENIDKKKLTSLLEESFHKKLDEIKFYERLERCMSFVIVAGDYQGAAIVTEEIDLDREEEGGEGLDDGSEKKVKEPIVYLDKFAVLPSLQGEGIVDFLWGALRDETFGLGSMDALNNNGGLAGIGEPVDLIWRSRDDNPVNRWYFERSNGFIKIGKPDGGGKLKENDDGKRDGGPSFSLFWCYAERREKSEYSGKNGRLNKKAICQDQDDQISKYHRKTNRADNFDVDPGRLKEWSRAIKKIQSAWIS